MTLRNSSYVNSFTSGEDINLNFIPNIEFSLSIADFTNVALRGRVCSGNVTLLRFASPNLALIVVTQLKCVVTSTVQSLNLKNIGWRSFNNCYRDKFTSLSEYLSHADFAA